MTNQDAYRTKTYLLADSNSRLYNGKIYSSLVQGSDDFIFRTFSDDKARDYIITELRNRGIVVEIDKKEEWYRDAHGSSYDTYFEISSNIDSDRWSAGDNLDYNNIGQYVMRRKESKFWKTFDPHKRYRLIEFDRNTGFLYLCDAKDEYGNEPVNLAEYDRMFPGEIEIIDEYELGINEPTKRKHLIVCPEDGGFKLY